MTETSIGMDLSDCLEVQKDSCLKFEVFNNYAKVFLNDKSSLLISLPALSLTLSQLAQKQNSELINTRVSVPIGTFFIGMSEDTLEVSIFVPAVRKKVKYISKNYEIPFPSFIISARFKKHMEQGNVVWLATSDKVKFFATNLHYTQLPGDFIYDSRPNIWVMPMPNFYSDGHMCVGQNTIPTRFPLSSVLALTRYIDVLYDGAFNADLTVPSLLERKNPETWLQFLSTKTEFPYECLA